MSMRKNEAVWVESLRRWQINVQSDGERKTFVSSTEGKKGKIEAEKKADKWLEFKLTDENTRVETLLDAWLEKLKAATSSAHHRQYDGYVRNWIKPVIGTRRVGRVTKNDLQKVVDKAYENGHLADKTLKNVRACIMSFMSYCRDGNATRLYPGRLTIPASAKKSNKTIAAPAELEKLFSSVLTTYKRKQTEDFFIHAYRFAVLTGLRPGELLGLMNSNIKGKKITITRSLNDSNEFTQGKNNNARRTYVLGKLALAVIDDQRKMLMKVGAISSYVFPSADMGYIDQEMLRRAWKRYCRANNIPTTLTPYELRHTFVSVNVEMPEALKKMVIGHSKDMDTEGTYGHEKQDDMELAATYIDAAFSKYIKK